MKKKKAAKKKSRTLSLARRALNGYAHFATTYKDGSKQAVIWRTIADLQLMIVNLIPQAKK